jgi:hypothetical protein
VTDIAEPPRPSMFRTAVEAAAGALPDAPTATVEQVALAVLRAALPLHETQHADAWKAAHERAVHFELESVKAAERAESAEKEVRRYRSFCGEAFCGDIERDRDEYLRQNEQLRADLERHRGVDAAAKELLARNVELGTSADNAKAKCEDLEDEVERLREQVGEEEVSWAVYAGYDPEDGDMYHSTAEEYARDAADKGAPVTKWVTRVYPTAVYNMELDESGEWRKVPDA